MFTLLASFRLRFFSSGYYHAKTSQQKSKSKCNDGVSDCQRCVTRGIACEDIDPHSGRSYPRGNPVRLAGLWKDMQQQNVEQQQSAEQQQIAGYPGAWSAQQEQVAEYPSGAWSIQHQQTAEYPSGARSAQPPLSRADTVRPNQNQKTVASMCKRQTILTHYSFLGSSLSILPQLPFVFGGPPCESRSIIR